MDDFNFRDALPEDKEEILALTADTWEEGDYIKWVFDDWVKDAQGRFLVAEDSFTGRIAGIDKMSFLSPSEAWFEGLRIHADYRGRGLALRLERFMISEAARLGATTIRLLTNIDNLPIHRNAYRHGFSQRFIVRPWQLKGSEELSPEPSSSLTLGPATPDEAPAIYEWWRRTSAWQATDGLLHRDWSFSSTSGEEWVERSIQKELLIPSDSEIERLTLPPPLVMFSRDVNEAGGLRWTISSISATGMEWGPLTSGLVEYARNSNVSELFGLLPESANTYHAFETAGFTPESDKHCLCMFESALGDDRSLVSKIKDPASRPSESA